MFESLKETDWREVKHSHGSAAEVPQMLLALAQGSPERQQKALDYFWSYMVHQESRVEASPLIVPYLFEILEKPGWGIKRELIDLLLGLAVGLDEFFLPRGYDAEEEEARLARKEWICLFNYEEARLSYYAVMKRAELFVRFMGPEWDKEVRLSAAFAAAHFGKALEGSISQVQEWLVHERDEMQRQSLMLCLGMLLRHSSVPRDASLFMSAEDSPSLQVAGAIAALTAMESRAPEKAVETLLTALRLAALREPAELRSARVDWLWWNGGDLLGYAGRALLLAAPQYREQTVGAYCSALRGLKIASFAIPFSMLDLLFPGRKQGERVKVDDLTDLQRAGLKALLESPHWRDWMIRDIFFSNDLMGPAYQSAVGDVVKSLTGKPPGSVGRSGNVSSWDLDKRP